MNKKWVDEHEKERQGQIDLVMSEIEEYISHNTTLFQNEIDEVSKSIRENGYMNLSYMSLMPFRKIIDERKKLYKELYGEDTTTVGVFLDNMLKCADGLKEYYERLFNLQSIDYSNYLDSEEHEFDGDIIITDPCYVIKNNDEYDNCGLRHYMYRDTIYGDWGCTTFDTDSGEPIGDFCADAGLVAVMQLDEVLEYNPSFDYHINRPWTTTLIKDFKGTVQFVVKRYEYTEYGKDWADYAVEVVGHGVNKTTGKPINFVGKQTKL
jgi:hypothetical protein